jgi:hypothetical protein
LHQVVKLVTKFHGTLHKNNIFHHWWGHVFTWLPLIIIFSHYKGFWNMLLNMLLGSQIKPTPIITNRWQLNKKMGYKLVMVFFTTYLFKTYLWVVVYK